MNRTASGLGKAGLIGLALFGLGLAGARGFLPSGKPELPNLDKRASPAAKAHAPESNQQAALAQLKARLPNAKVDWDEVVGTPKVVAASDGFLSGPDGRGKGISATGADVFGKSDPNRAVKAFLKEHGPLFGHGPEALATARAKREQITPHNGLRTVVWEQQLDDIAVFEGLLVAHTTKQGELVQVSSQFVRRLEQAAERGTPKRAVVRTAPAISAAQAVAIAAQNVGESLTEVQVTAVGKPEATAEARQQFKGPGLKGECSAKLVWLPLDKETLRLCWDVLFTSRSRGEMFRVLVDVQSGEVLVRRCLTDYLTNATYRVFTSDSPSPFSPGHPTPQSSQPPLVSRTLMTLSALDTNASPNGWINDGGNETLGNNVDAHLDRNADDAPDLPRPQGSPFRVFDFPVDLAGQDPTNYGAAAVVQVFYTCNWMHDKLYELGFTEAAGNFQSNNFGRGGLGNDAVQADAQDGEGTDNANMSTPPDGSAPRMQMFIFTGPSPRRDGDLDAEIVLHEYTHGLSNRRVGGGAGLSTLQSQGMGEGWSDFYALTLLSEASDDVNGNYAAAAYASYLISSGFTQNYYYGIRRYPYSTDLTKNPLTFKDIDPSQASSHAGVPISPAIGSGSASEVHNQGEVWCVTLWEARANLINKHGWAVGNQLILQLVTDGMNLSPANPNFLQARDAIIQADRVNTGGANLHELWAAFAKRGMGASATSPASSTTTGVHEAYDLPDDLQITPNSGFTASGPVGGPFSPNSMTLVLTNTGTNLINWTLSNTSAWLNVSSSGGTLIPGGPAGDVTVSLNSTPGSLPMGVYSDTVWFTNVTSGASLGRSFMLRVGQPDYFTELFEAADSDLGFSTFTFTPNGSADFYAICREVATNFPTDPTGGTNVSLTDDSYARITLATTNTVAIYSRRTNVFFIGSNGYITLNSSDTTYTESLAVHFNRPRISALFDDLNPGARGTVSWQQLSDRAAVTWLAVPEYGTVNTNSFQIEMFYDGRLRITYLTIMARDGLAGLSAGLGVPTGFLESDFTSYAPCTVPLLVTVPASATEGQGVLAGQGHVLLPAPAATNLTVGLTSSDTTEVTVPATVTVPAGQTSASFDLTIVDDTELDGTQAATITAAANGYVNGSAMITVYDNETATLRVSLPAAVVEGSGSTQGVVQVSAPPSVNVTVSLASSDLSQIQVPASVIIPAGQTSVVFAVTVMDDAWIDGPQTVTVTAHVPNWTDGSAAITILDNENVNLTVTVPAYATEGDGVLTNGGQVRLSGLLPTNLVVGLISSDLTEATVPPTVIIPAGQNSVAFNVTIVDDVIVDGNQSVTITANAPGFNAGTATLVVLDDESPPLPSNPNPAHLATNVSALTGLAWSGCGLGVSNDVYFGTNPAPGPAEYLGHTTNCGWVLPRLAPNTTYYWKIIARKLGTTAGPVWQFTTRGVDHFDWSVVASPQFLNQPFMVTLTAIGESHFQVTNFAGPVRLTGSAIGGSIPISPAASGNFTNGVWTGTITVSSAATNLVLLAEDGAGHNGQSNPFDVTPTNQPPLIVIPPASQVVGQGAIVDFTVSVFGTPPFSYQWRFQGANLPGSIQANLRLTNVSSNEAGNYSVVVANAFGSVTSAPAALTVVNATPFFDDFDPAIDWPQWSGLSSNVLATNYGGSVSAPNALWFDGDATRQAVTRPLNTMPGGVVDFWLRLADGTGIPWEQVDLPSEGIVLEYTTDAGSNWVELGRYDTTTYYNWTHVSVDIPGAAQTATTQFRWRQLAHSGSGYDNWALDEAGVYVGPRPPRILTQPVGGAVGAGSQVTFSVTVSGTAPLAYQWRKEGVDIEGATNASCTLAAVQTNDTGNYSVRATNIYGSVLSSNATLNVVPLEAVIAVFNDPTYVDTTSSGVGAEANNVQASLRSLGLAVVTFTNFLEATALYRRLLIPELEIRDLAPDLTAAAKMALSNFVVQGGSLVIHGATMPRAGNLLNTVFGLAVQETLTGDGFYLNPAAAGGTGFAQGPANLTVNNATAVLQAGSLPPDALGLYTNAAGSAVAAMPCGSGSIIYLGWDWFNAVPMGAQDGGWLAVLGSAARQGPLPPRPPVIVGQPASRVAVMGGTAVFSVQVIGSRPVQYQWLKEGQAIAGATAATITVANVQSNDAGHYSVAVTNLGGWAVSSNATLRVLPAGTVIAVFDDPAYVSTGGGNGAGADNVQAGLQDLGFPVATFTNVIEASGLYRHLLFPEQLIRDLAGDLTPAARAALSNFVAQGGALIVHGAVPSRAAHLLNTLFGLTVQEVAGSGGPHARTPDAAGTEFADAPTSLPDNYATTVLQRGSLPAGARKLYTNSVGSAVALLQWGDGTIVFLGWNWYGAAPVGTQDGGWQTVLASAALQGPFLPRPPVINVQPASRQIAAGNGTTFNVSVSGAVPFAYQWRKDGQAIGGATSASYTLPSAQTSDAGNYSVLVTNLYGQALSSNALLTVVVLGEFFDDFEPDIDSLQWAGFSSNVLAISYGGSISGDNSLWFGGDDARLAVTRPLNTTTGGTVDFCLRLADGPLFPWEQVDLPAKGIVLEYSVNRGTSWIELDRYDTPDFYSWKPVSANIPPAAQTAATQFRWRQLAHSGACCDHWALDDVRVSTDPLPLGLGLFGEYFDNLDLSNLKITRLDPTVDFDWGAAAPDPAIERDTFSVRWTGSVLPRYSDLYTFHVYSDSGARLWVNNQLVVDDWSGHPAAETNGSLSLVAGQWCPIRLEYFENVSNAIVRLSWSSAHVPRQVVPQNRLSPTPTILAFPLSQVVCVGSNVTFAVAATGLAPLSYQWFFNATKAVLDGTNADLLLPQAQTTNSGNYQVIITNFAGAVTSQVASLLVLPPDTDSDGDGMPDWLEYRAGTDPHDPLSVLRVQLQDNGQGGVRLEFTAMPNIGYTIQYCTNLTSATWLNFTNVPPATWINTVRLSDPYTSAYGSRFYRIVIPMQP